jgi:hypothetical protein
MMVKHQASAKEHVWLKREAGLGKKALSPWQKSTWNVGRNRLACAHGIARDEGAALP